MGRIETWTQQNPLVELLCDKKLFNSMSHQKYTRNRAVVYSKKIPSSAGSAHQFDWESLYGYTPDDLPDEIIVSSVVYRPNDGSMLSKLRSEYTIGRVALKWFEPTDEDSLFAQRNRINSRSTDIVPLNKSRLHRHTHSTNDEPAILTIHDIRLSRGADGYFTPKNYNTKYDYHAEWHSYGHEFRDNGPTLVNVVDQQFAEVCWFANGCPIRPNVMLGDSLLSREIELFNQTATTHTSDVFMGDEQNKMYFLSGLGA